MDIGALVGSVLSWIGTVLIWVFFLPAMLLAEVVGTAFVLFFVGMYIWAIWTLICWAARPITSRLPTCLQFDPKLSRWAGLDWLPIVLWALLFGALLLVVSYEVVPLLSDVMGAVTTRR